MEIVACDFCGSKDYITVVRQTDLIHKSTSEFFSIVECEECGLNYTNPRPSIEELGSFYTESYSYFNKGGLLSFIKTNILGPLIRLIANSPFAYIFFFIPTLSNLLGSKVEPKVQDPVLKYFKEREIKSFLDIGCGSGVKAHFWGTRSSLLNCPKTIEVFGCEPDEASRKFLNDNDIYCWSAIEDIEKDRKFDLIRMNWSLEHVHCPSKYFEFINQHLSSKGRAIIAVPNF